MMKAVGTQGNGVKVLILGLEKRNVELLQQGKPMIINGKVLGLDHDTMIVYGENSTKIMSDLRKSGFNLPMPKIEPGHASLYEKPPG